MRISDWSSDVCSSDFCPTGITTTAMRAAAAGWPLMPLACVFSAHCQPNEHYDAQTNPIPSERTVGASGHKAQYGPHHNQRTDKSSDKAHHNGSQLCVVECAAVAIQVIDRSRQHGGRCQEERELGGCFTLYAGDHAADDGGA